MRISPELFLKQLVIGGMDRVYEIGKQFRNEGIDATHNPEFTTCEFYQAYSNFAELQDLTQSLLQHLVRSVRGNEDAISVQLKPNDEPVKVDFFQPFKRVDFLSALEAAVGCSLPSLQDEEASVAACLDLCRKFNIGLFLHTTHQHTPHASQHTSPNCLFPPLLVC
eukprot:m.208806 g.208806  ORF g.208806 m.208806 type:complete len:166 (+) comp22083_c0_seq1:234-731(+)